MDSQSSKRSRQASSISDNVLIVSEPLCFMFKKFKQLPEKLFKQLVMDFYSTDIITEAKNTLLVYMEKLELEKWSKPTRRRKESVDKAGSKLKLETDDIVSMLIYIDEQKLYENLPYAKLSEGDLQCILNRLSCISGAMSSLNDLIINSFNTITANLATELDKRLVELIGSAHHTQLQDSLEAVRKQTACLDSSDLSSAITAIRKSMEVVCHQTACLEDPSFTSAVTLMASQQRGLSHDTNVNRPSHSDAPTDNCSTEPESVIDTDNTAFTDVNYNRKVRKSVNGNSNISSTQMASYSQAISSNAPNIPQPLAPKPVQTKKRTIMGDSNTCPLKASKNLQIKKSVYKISNLDSNYTDSDIKKYLESLKIRTLTCFELPRGKFEKEGNKSFRVCIYFNDKHILLSKNNWSSGILIKEWVFRPKNPPVAEESNSLIPQLEPTIVHNTTSNNSIESMATTQTT
jgi:hypothetical protein